jgi:hypothetical protein
MARRQVIWHIGPDDPGATFLADALEQQREELTATTAELERLSVEVARLRRENAALDRKRRKHKRRAAELAKTQLLL